MRKLFPSQIEGEKVYLVVREHWVYFALKVFIWGFFFALYIAIRIWGPGILPEAFDATTGQITTLVLNIYLLILVLTIFILWALYYLNIQIIILLKMELPMR